MGHYLCVNYVMDNHCGYTVWYVMYVTFLQLSYDVAYSCTVSLLRLSNVEPLCLRTIRLCVRILVGLKVLRSIVLSKNNSE